MPKQRKAVKVVIQPTKKSKRVKQKEREREVTILGSALRNLGAFGGSALGNFVGQAEFGSRVGQGLGAMISKWLGSGDYKISSNSILRTGGNLPSMHSTKDGFVVRHKEFLTEVKSTTDFTVAASFPINPAIASTFPWLSKIAQHFEEYEIKGMVYHYIPTSGYSVSSSNPALGSVMLQTTYRANSPAPTGKMEMMNEYCASEARPADEFVHPIECSPKETPFSIHYTRTGALSSPDSPLMYDLGTTFLATSGCPAVGNIVGELWVTYEVVLRKPIVALFTMPLGFNGNTSVGLDSSHLFGTSFNTTFTNFPAPITFSGNTMTMGAGIIGTFLVVVGVSGGTANTFGYLSLTGSGSSAVNAFNGSTTLQYNVGTGSSGAALAIVTITNSSTSTVLTFTNSAFTATRVYVTIAQISSQVV